MNRAFEQTVGTARVVAARNATGAIPIAYNLIQLVLPREMFSHNLYSGNMFLMMKLMMPFPVIIGGLAVRRFLLPTEIQY